ncbi:MAG: hypothetical protein KCHDKBKB_01876 [Elusimicrobia bacterium]|nr:hypothetical protein [Elusimicrobiota bacterium]
MNWHPWHEDALKQAKEANLPIFLSIGYSTCHWCHVMAHESFENENTAKFMNENFFNIKVDREERPDVDAIYMMAVQALTGSGGWPLSVWLTPDLKPFFAGTYFPPEERYGRASFSSVLHQLADIWFHERSKILESAEQISEMLKQFAGNSSQAVSDPLQIRNLARQTYESLQSMFDPKFGGFGPAPKFPMPVYLSFLLDYFERTHEPNALAMVELTMEKISMGGIYDQLGGGYARYSTDEKWLVPHFEKMLYDNAQLISVTAQLFKLTGQNKWKELTREAVSYVIKDLGHPEGGFYSAEDADSEGKEGTFYLWTLQQVIEHLTQKEADAFIKFFGPTLQGNFVDPHHLEDGKNILAQTGASVDPEALISAKKKLLAVRNQRPRPARDEKILVEWNGLMISALIQAFKVLQDPSYLEMAEKTAQFIHRRMFDSTAVQLYRSWCDGVCIVKAQQSDFSFLIQGLLDLYECSNKDNWKGWAVQLQEIHDQLFFDEELGGYFMNNARPDLLIRLKDNNDNVIPSGNSIAVRNGFRLTRLIDRPEFQIRAKKTIQAFSSRLVSQPTSMVSLVSILNSNLVEL